MLTPCVTVLVNGLWNCYWRPATQLCDWSFAALFSACLFFVWDSACTDCQECLSPSQWDRELFKCIRIHIDRSSVTTYTWILCTHARTHAHTHTHTHPGTHIQMCASTCQSYVHTHAHTHTRAHTHTDTHTISRKLRKILPLCISGYIYA